MATPEGKSQSLLPPYRRHYRTEPACLPSRETNRKCLQYSNSDTVGYFEPVGVWTIFCDFTSRDENGLTELDRVWNTVKLLYDEGIFPKVTCFTVAHSISLGLPETRGIYCYVPDYTDIENVILSAAKLRKRCVNFPYPIILKTVTEHNHSKINRYLCCVDGDFYTCDELGWKLYRSSIVKLEK